MSHTNKNADWEAKSTWLDLLTYIREGNENDFLNSKNPRDINWK